MSHDTLQYYGAQFLRKLVDLKSSITRGVIVDTADFNMCCDIVQNLLEFEVQCQVPCRIPEMKIPTANMLNKTKHSEFKRITNMKKIMNKYDIRFVGIIRCGNQSLIESSADFAPKLTHDNTGNYMLSVNLANPPFEVSRNIQYENSTLSTAVGSSSCGQPDIFPTVVASAGQTVTEVPDLSDFQPTSLPSACSAFLGDGGCNISEHDDDSVNLDALWTQDELDQEQGATGDMESLLYESHETEKKNVATQTRIIYHPFGLDFASFE